MLQGVKQRLDKIQNANALIEQKVQEAETRLRGEVKSSLEALPQRLLATDAMKDLKESLLEELHRELAQLRQDLQKQVDELKQARKQ
jgi:high-affinity Fe2+/Pb2+ permease